MPVSACWRWFGQGHRIELADRVVAAQDHARIFPGDRRAGLDLGPGNPRARAAAVAALGHEVVDAADAVLVARIPVLHGRVLDPGIVERDQLHHRRVQLVLVAHRRGAAFEVADRRAFLGDDQGALELAGVARVDPEVGRQLHRALDALRDEDERAVGEHRRVQRGVEVVALRHDRAQVLLHQLRMVLHRLGERAEDDAVLAQLLLEGGRHRHRVEHRVDRDAGKAGALVQRHAELLVGAQQFRVDVVEALRAVLALLRRRVVDDVLEVDRRETGPWPSAAASIVQPAAVGLQAPLEHELGLALAGRDQPDRVLRQALGERVGLELGDEAGRVLAIEEDRRACRRWRRPCWRWRPPCCCRSLCGRQQPALLVRAVICLDLLLSLRRWFRRARGALCRHAADGPADASGRSKPTRCAGLPAAPCWPR